MEALASFGACCFLVLVFLLGRCSMDETWENACRKNKPVVIDSEVYACRKK